MKQVHKHRRIFCTGTMIYYVCNQGRGTKGIPPCTASCLQQFFENWINLWYYYYSHRKRCKFMEKMTKRDYFNLLRARVADDSDLVAFIDHEIDLLNRKNERRASKPSKAQMANAVLMDVIYNAMDEGVAYTVSEIHKMIPELAEFSGNKVSALVRGLRLDGRVIRSEVKGRAYFTKAWVSQGRESSLPLFHPIRKAGDKRGWKAYCTSHADSEMQPWWSYSADKRWWSRW